MKLPPPSSTLNFLSQLPFIAAPLPYPRVPYITVISFLWLVQFTRDTGLPCLWVSTVTASTTARGKQLEGKMETEVCSSVQKVKCAMMPLGDVDFC